MSFFQYTAEKAEQDYFSGTFNLYAWRQNEKKIIKYYEDNSLRGHWVSAILRIGIK